MISWAVGAAWGTVDRGPGAVPAAPSARMTMRRPRARPVSQARRGPAAYPQAGRRGRPAKIASD
jgi:hypothetical protein